MKLINRYVLSERALLARINRALRDELEIVKKTRDGSRARLDLGEYYLLDLRRNAIARHDLDLEAFARELKVLNKYEKLEERE